MKKRWPKWVPVLAAAWMSLGHNLRDGRGNLNYWHDEVFRDYLDAFGVFWEALVKASGMDCTHVFMDALYDGKISPDEQARIWNKARRALGYTEVEDGAWDE